MFGSSKYQYELDDKNARKTSETITRLQAELAAVTAERDRAVKRMEAGWIEVCDSGILAFKEMNDELRTQLTAAQEEIERLKSLSTTLEGQLGKRACQNNRCLEYNRLAAELAKYRDAPVVVWRTHPFDYGIGHKGVYASSHFKEQGDAWERKGWKVEHLIVKPGEEK